MKNEFDISEYAGYFHDGNLFNILNLENEIGFQMSSAEIDSSEIEKELGLSKDRRIQGILHLCHVKSIHLTGKCGLGNFFDVFNLGTILDFEITDRTATLGILWENFPPKVHTNEFTTIVIEAERIWWENIPDSFDPL